MNMSTAAVTANQGKTLDAMYAAWQTRKDTADTVNCGQIATRKHHHRVITGLAERGLIRCVRSFPSGDALFGLTEAGRQVARSRKYGA